MAEIGLLTLASEKSVRGVTGSRAATLAQP